MKQPGVRINVVNDDHDDHPSPAPRPRAPEPRDGGAVAGPPPAFDLDVVSDVVCPWCWVGKRRLEKALALLGPGARVTVTWRPFQLNPGMPREGMDRREYIEAKFGSVERYRVMEERLAAAGSAEGIDFRFDRIARVPNTLDAHRLIRLAGEHGRQDAVVEALFRAYFHDAADLADRRALVSVAEAAGVDAALTEAALSSDEGLRAVAAEEWRFKALGVTAVPSFVAAGGVLLFSGAVEPHMMAEAFRRRLAAGTG